MSASALGGRLGALARKTHRRNGTNCAGPPLTHAGGGPAPRPTTPPQSPPKSPALGGLFTSPACRSRTGTYVRYRPQADVRHSSTAWRSALPAREDPAVDRRHCTDSERVTGTV